MKGVGKRETLNIKAGRSIIACLLWEVIPAFCTQLFIKFRNTLVAYLL